MRHMSEIVRHQNPVMLSPGASVQHACERMRERGVGAVLVLDAHRHLVGIFSGRDAVCRVLAAGLDPAKTRLGDVMTRDPATMPPGKTALEALHLMQEGGFRHVPVIDNDKVVGVVSKGDFRGIEQARLDEETGIWEQR